MARYGVVLALAIAACGPTVAAPSPANPPGARADGYSPFPSAYDAQALAIADRLRAQIGGDCLETRMLRVDAAAARQVAPHYSKALTGWSAVRVASSSGDAVGYVKGDARFAAAVMRRGWQGWHALVIVTNTAWDDQSRAERTRCLRG